MDLLHVIFAFNLVTSLGILAACYLQHRNYDPKIAPEQRVAINFAGMSGAALALGLMSGIATMFV